MLRRREGRAANSIRRRMSRDAAICLALLGCACSAHQQTAAPLSANERLEALQRGLRFEQEVMQSRYPHRVEQVIGIQAPRTHSNAAPTLFVISGEVIVQVEGDRKRLRSGDTLQIPAGQCYFTQTVDAGVSSVLFTFWEGGSPAEPLGSPFGQPNSAVSDWTASAGR